MKFTFIVEDNCEATKITHEFEKDALYDVVYSFERFLKSIGYDLGTGRLDIVNIIEQDDPMLRPKNTSCDFDIEISNDEFDGTNYEHPFSSAVGDYIDMLNQYPDAMNVQFDCCCNGKCSSCGCGKNAN